MNRYPTTLKEKKVTTEKKRQLRKRKKKINFKLILVTCIWVLFSASIVFSLNNDFLPKHTDKTLTFVVSEGDSLWSIGKLYCPEGMDIRKYIHQIMELNNMQDTTIYVYESIIIPIIE